MAACNIYEESLKVMNIHQLIWK